ncbi:VOC family protein [Glaciimonas soli]|nr:VOC family protein [Glaciimonas soli]
MKNEMKFGYTIVYVSSVPATLAFYKEAFGFETRFLHDSNDYGELETGATVLAFGSHTMGDMNLNGQYQKVNPNAAPLGVELAFVTDDVASAYAKAVAAGAEPINEPADKPWGQVVAYVRDKDGSLIELCSPMGA